MAGCEAQAKFGGARAGGLAGRGRGRSCALIGTALYGLHRARQLRALDIDDVDLCLRLFRQNRDTGLILVVAFLLAGFV